MVLTGRLELPIPQQKKGPGPEYTGTFCHTREEAEGIGKMPIATTLGASKLFRG
jgi:hypothetical protein